MDIPALSLEKLYAMRSHQWRTARMAERMAARSMFDNGDYYTALANNCDQAIVFINDEIERRGAPLIQPVLSEAAE